jgi:hypothetical protein
MKHDTSFFSSIGIAIALSLLSAPAVFAYVASSSNYQIQTDSINTGGLLSTSSSYTIEDTLGEAAVGTSSSATYQVKAGYQQMQETYLAVSLSGNVSLSPNIPTVGGGTADGSASWTVITDNPAGYSMTIRSSSTPALSSGANNFPNYTPAGADPDLNFTTPAAASRFGFTPEGADIVQRFKDNGAVCNAGSGDTVSACWDALLAAPTTIATRPSGNQPAGTMTTVRFRAVSDVANVQPAGSYAATTTVTVLAL